MMCAVTRAFSSCRGRLPAHRCAGIVHEPTPNRAPHVRWAATEIRGSASSQHHAAWRLLAYTGMRRGEALALRWRDVSLDAGTVSVRRSAGVIRVKGEGAA